MTFCKELHALLSGEILKEFESVSAQIDAFAQHNTLNETQIEEREVIMQLQGHFQEILDAIETHQMDEKECEEALNELYGMKAMGAQMGL